MMAITHYRFEDVYETDETYEEFLNNLFKGLEHYRKRNPDFKFKITYTKDCIELKVIKMNEQAN